MNKKGLEFKSAMFAIVAVGIIMSAVTANLLTWNEKYNSGLTIGDTFSKYDESGDIKDTANEYQDSISPQSAKTDDDTETQTYRGVFGIITTIFNPFKLIIDTGGFLDMIAKDYGIPNYIIVGFSTIIVLSIVFAIVAVIFRLNRTSV